MKRARSGGVPKPRANLADEIRQIGLDHERVGPERPTQGVLSESLRARLHEQDQQPIGLGRQLCFVALIASPPSDSFDLPLCLGGGRA